VTSQNLIILAAGKPHRGELPVLLTQVNGQTLFDWQINALSVSDPYPQVVVGYAAEEFNKLSERAQFRTNEKWESTGSGYSLLSADLSGDSVIVSYADILYRPSVIEVVRQSNSDVTLVYDSCWKQRFVGRTEKDLIGAEKVIVSDCALLSAGQNLPVDWAHGEFIGLVHFQGVAMECLRSLQNQNNTSLGKMPLSGLVEWLRLQGLSVSVVDLEGDWAELNEPKDVAHFILGTKAETLDRLSKMVSKSVVLDQVSFTVADWRENTRKIVQNIQKVFSGLRVVVRSSAKSEDAFTYSNAGAYSSLLDVDLKKGLQDAIIEVISSYADCQLDDQVLVQPMLQDVRLSGVAFTRTLEEGAPFYIVNYAENGDTESITSGCSKEHKSLYLRKDAELTDVSERSAVAIIEAIKEVEYLLNYDALDIEFACDKQGQVYLLQVRPIATADSLDSDVAPAKVLELQEKASNYWLTLQAASPQIRGDKALFGVMPDWNPAEIIGTNPGQLAVSLYEHLILNDIWAKQRAEYGYKDVRPQPLLRIFAGKPYIDIRASFNSFIPEALSDDLSQKLVNFYLSWLEAHPSLHDKVEFEVAPTCFGPMFGKWEKRLAEKAGLIDEEISQLKQGLLGITQGALTRTTRDLAALVELQRRHDQVASHKTVSSSEKIRLLLENCKEFGTLPFAHLARSGFIAVTLLKEGVEAGWLSVDARDGFMETIHSVSHELSKDAWRAAQGQISWNSFVAEYGHLRPGTYDITSPAYRDYPEQFLRPLIEHAQQPKPTTNKVIHWQDERGLFFANLRAMGLHATDIDFERFLIEAIEGREKAKFIFSRSLSESLRLLETEGAKYKLTPNELSDLSLNDLLSAFNAGLTVEKLSVSLKAVSLQNQQARKVSHACQLPPLLFNLVDFRAFVLTEEKPNYIGTARITAKVVYLNNRDWQQVKVDGCIVVIPQADPGYDWLFGQNIAGLITMYGGANSHMAIRAAEFGLPAAIGVGEQVYKTCDSAKIIELDSAGETIRVLQ
jgi:choline kinase/phosphohistidine swiveling domain-containing protein